MTVYRVNQQELHARTEGQPYAPIALLIHGWSSSWYTWKPLIPALSQRFYCVAVDLPGYGRSPAPTTPPSIAGYADLLAGLIQQLSDDAVLVMGHSMGGQIAMTLALRSPVLVERMVLLNPAVSGRLSTFIDLFVAPHILLERFKWAGRLLSWIEHTPLGYTDKLLKPISFAERAIILDQDYKRIRADARRPGQGAVRAQCYWAMKQGDLRSQLHRIQTPALVLWGAEDNTVPLRDAGAVAAEWPAADLRLIPNAGHWPQFEQFDITLRYVAAFLGLPQVRGVEDDVTGLSRDVPIAEIAQFLVNSDLGYALTPTQRARLAAQFRLVQFPPQARIAAEDEEGKDMYLIQQGTVEVWARVNADGTPDAQPGRIATVIAGRVVGEMAILEEDGKRSGELRAGSQGATVLALSRQRFDALCQDDPALGLRVMQNLARALSLRLRLQNWQLQNAERRYEQALRARRQELSDP